MEVRQAIRSIALVAMAIVLATPAASQDAKDPLDIFKPLTEKVWLGHYSDSETSHFNHIVRWTSELGGKAVRAVKKVPELDFEIETLYFWDAGRRQVAFVSLTNRGQLSRGTVSSENGVIVALGVSVEKGGDRDFKMTLAAAKGTLEDRFFLKRDGQWHQGHLITYKVTTDPAFTQLFD